MKKRIVALLIAVMLVVGLVPSVAFAGATDTWDFGLKVTEEETVTYNSQKAIEVAFAVQSDNLSVKTAQGVVFAVNLDVFDFINPDGTTAYTALSTSLSEDQSTNYVFNSYMVANRNYWAASVKYAKSADGKTGYVVLQPSHASALACATEVELASILLGFKQGKSVSNLTSSDIRLATAAEAKSLGQDQVLIVTDGGSNTQKYGFEGTGTAFSVTPAVDWGFEVSQPALAGSVTISGTLKYNEELTATVTGAQDAALKYQWYRGEEEISGATNEKYTLVAADIGKTITVKVTSDSYSGELTDDTDTTIGKATQNAPAGTLTAKTVTHNSIELNSISGAEYYIDTHNTITPGEVTWQSSPVFEGLYAGVDYYAYARYPGNETTEPSGVIYSAAIKTQKTPGYADLFNIRGISVTYNGADQKSTVQSAISYNASVVGQATFTYKYSNDGGQNWSDTTEIKNAGQYEIFVTTTEGSQYAAIETPTSIGKFIVAEKSISEATITLGTAPTYNATEQTISINSVKVDGTTLTADVDYTIKSGDKATNVADTTLTIEGKGNYQGTATVKWSINPLEVTLTPVEGQSATYGSSLPLIGYSHGLSEDALKTAFERAAANKKLLALSGYEGNAGDYTIVLANDAQSLIGSNFTLKCTEGKTFKVDRATVQNKTLNVTVRSGETTTDQEVQLPALEGAATYPNSGTVGGSTTALISGHSITGTKLKISTTNQTDGTSATIAISVPQSTNHKAYTVTVTVTAKDKDDISNTITFADKTVTYGDTFTHTATTTATGGEMTYTYTGTSYDGTYTGGTEMPTVAGEYQVTAKYENETQLGTKTATLKINKKNVTIAGLGAENKVYDGDKDATPSGTATVSGKVDNDNVTVTAGTASFADKNVSTSKTVTFSDYSLGGTAAANYNLTGQPANTTANITPKGITITSGVDAVDRDYNGETTVALTGTAVFDGVIGSDNVTAVLTAGGTIEDPNADETTPKTVTTSITLGGTDGGNYTLTAQPTINVIIRKADAPTGIEKIYNVVFDDTEAKTVEVSDFTLPAGGTLGAKFKGEATNNTGEDILAAAPSNTSFQLKSGLKATDAGRTATWTVLIESTNYDDITATVKVAISDKSEANVTIKDAPTTKKYSDADFTLAAEAANTGDNGAWEWTSSDTSVLTVDNTGKVSIVGVGTATVTAKYESDTTVGTATTATITVGKGTITITVADITIEVDDEVPTPTDYTVTGLKSGENIGGTIVLKYQQNGEDAEPDNTTEGVYDIVASGATCDDTKYDIVYVTGTLTIEDGNDIWDWLPWLPGYDNPFTDVKDGDFFYEPVLWAVEKGVTDGTSKTTFSPNLTCNRAQAITFLWRAMGEPRPASYANPFTDVKEGTFYYEAVLWAYGAGITDGISATRFGVNEPVIRAQFVTFLYRAMHQPNTAPEMNVFTDVPADAYYAKAVNWAVYNGITDGMSATTFAPAAACNRAQIVTFLYRAFK